MKGLMLEFLSVIRLSNVPDNCYRSATIGQISKLSFSIIMNSSVV